VEPELRYALAADAILVLHALFILFATLGGLLAAWRRWLAALHLPCLAWAVWIEVSGGICPLTPLENHFRRLAGRGAYEVGFVEQYLLPLVYPAALTPVVQLALAGLLLATNLAVYAWVLRRWRR